MEETLEKIRGGDRRLLARIISRIENGDPAVLSLLKQAFRHAGHARVVGVTGAPGAGKSSLVDQLTARIRLDGSSVAVVAVDPSSPFSGGAILGDRVRMQRHAADPGTFIRSMATRGNLGGLSGTTADVVLLLDAAGFDYVLVETVGVGQDEVDIVKTAQICLVVLVPGMGDDIQAIKAGIMEIGDVFVINKADREGTSKTEQEIRAILAMNNREDGWTPPVVQTVAIRGEGTDSLFDEIRRMEAFIDSRGRQGRFALRSTQEKMLQLSRDRLFEDFLAVSGFGAALPDLAQKVLDKSADPYSIIENFITRYKGKGEV
jgi:LAO/AO transport system kinase